MQEISLNILDIVENSVRAGAGKVGILVVNDIDDATLTVTVTDNGRGMTAEETDLPLRPISYDDAPTPSGAAMLAEAYARLRPDDVAGLDRLLVPATGIVVRASYMAGTWLRVMTAVVEDAR